MDWFQNEWMMDTRKAEERRLREGVNKQLMFEGEEWL